jgi:cardiolipin synthase
VGRAPLTFRRLSGLDRSGPPPPETQAGAPLRPWTIPNAIGYLRAALIPTFLLLALSSDDGTDALPATLFAIVAWGDYADGIAARVTRQYSRMGALMDPIIDRALVIAGVIVCWKFDLLPRWMLAVMIGREVFMLLAGQYALRKGATL